MATVRLTNDLQETILNAAKALFNKRVSEAQASIPEMEDGDFVLNRLFDAKPELRETLNQMQRHNLTTKSSTVRVRWIGDKTVDLRMARSRNLPFQWTSDYYANTGIALHSDPYQPLFADVYQKHTERAQRIAEVTAERDAFVEKVKTVLRNASTLKQAMSMWPGLWELVPQQVKDTHNSVVERRARAAQEEKPEVDVDSLNAAVVTARIVEGVI